MNFIETSQRAGKQKQIMNDILKQIYDEVSKGTTISFSQTYPDSLLIRFRYENPDMILSTNREITLLNISESNQDLLKRIILEWNERLAASGMKRPFIKDEQDFKNYIMATRQDGSKLNTRRLKCVVDAFKRMCFGLWHAVGEGAYDSRSPVGDIALDMKVNLFGDDETFTREYDQWKERYKGNGANTGKA